ncbi:hypothetical protein NONO_c44480 [Nocardia nova SH22a]|uniref:NERD domain-containing protein n=1 Tax=Nocardia nova SH22a TaxID=1415166 RepID=W5TJ14_9NOCA|nr:hypothetical protein [Nocardia nova]AHH19232.1 hypothetical protein NONO_c44480 [Nocardia nova SH22a]
MLVKVRNDDPSRLSNSERTVANWLKTWTGAHALPGIAVVAAGAADAIVWTPKTCVVIVIKDFTERVTGTLTVSGYRPWTVDDRVAPLDGTEAGTEPMTEIRARTGELAQLLRGAPGRERVGVTGMVLVMPQLGSRVALDKGDLPDGMDIVLGDGPAALRNYFSRITTDAPDTWDATQVGQALGALGFAAAATHSDLTAEGFPAQVARTPPPAAPAARPRAGRRPAGAPIPTEMPAPAGAAVPGTNPVSMARPAPPRGGAGPAPAPGPVAVSAQQAPPGPNPGPGQNPQPYSVPFDPRPPAPAPRRRPRRGVVPLVLLGVLVVVLLLAAMCTAGTRGSSGPAHEAPGSDGSSTSTHHYTPAPERTVPPTTPGRACYPFQPGCPG